MAKGAGRVRGMTLIEVLATMGILSVGIMALVQLHSRSEISARTSRARMVARDLAQGRLDRLAVQNLEVLPICQGAPTCRESRASLTPDTPAAGPYPCTQYINEASLGTPASQDNATRYRIDTNIVAHPDPLQQPGARLVTVSVCWAEEGGVVEEVRVERLFVPEV